MSLNDRDLAIAAAQAGKHVFCEKPFALTKADADAAVAATTKAGVTLGLGYNRRFHPEMTALRDKIRSGELGTVLHFEATMTFPNALALKADAWRADRDETPCGGLTPMGVHAIDGIIDEAEAIMGDASDHEVLDAAALDAVRQWEFTPTLLNGVPVPVIMTVTVQFTLQ